MMQQMKIILVVVVLLVITGGIVHYDPGTGKTYHVFWLLKT